MSNAELYRAETDRIEWKRSPQDSDGILRAACALANDLGGSGEPGRLVIGLDKDGFRRGIDAARLDQIQQDLSSRLRSTKIQPTPSFDIAVDHGDDGVTLLVITVIPYVDMGYEQQLGRGVRRLRLLLERNGNPPLEIEKDGFTRLILRARQ
jgi:predicted HTH transcriptional regulator